MPDLNLHIMYHPYLSRGGGCSGNSKQNEVGKKNFSKKNTEKKEKKDKRDLLPKSRDFALVFPIRALR